MEPHCPSQSRRGRRFGSHLKFRLGLIPRFFLFRGLLLSLLCLLAGFFFLFEAFLVFYLCDLATFLIMRSTA